MSAMDATTKMRLRVIEAASRDVGRGLIRLDPNDMESMGLRPGDIIIITGKRATVGKAMPSHKESRGQSWVQIDGVIRESAGCSIDDLVEIEKTACRDATQVTIRPRKVKPIERDLDYIASLVDGLPVQKGSVIRAILFGNESIDFDVQEAAPDGPVLITPNTKLIIEQCATDTEHRSPSYEDVGGAKAQLQRIREMIELPLKFPEVFERLGVSAPRGVLLYGPPGCGKTLIARAIAHEADAKFFVVSGPEIIHKHYGESEAHLRKIFEQASKQGPSIIFLDEIDAIAPKRENAAGDVERRVVAQLLTLMDGLKQRENVIVIAATNLPNSIDPALRRPGRFDREIEITIPDRSERLHILEIHTRGMPLEDDVDLRHFASITHGFVGADLEALCREAAMVCLRKLLDKIDLSQKRISYSQLASIRVSMSEFLQGFQSVEPSAIREVFVEVPNVQWDDVGGLESIKQQLREAITWPLKYEALFSQAKVRPARGVLLAGPPGVGKTMIAKAAATESQVNFISVKGPELLSKFVGESERAIRNIFSKARQAAPCLMFFDEIDGLCATRQSGTQDSGVSGRVLSQFLSEMDGIEEMNGVFVLAATNRPDMVDPALRRYGRFEQTIEVGLPDKASRKAILQVHLKNRPLAEKLDLDELADRTDGFSGADLASICSMAARSSIRRVVEQTKADNLAAATVLITRQDIFDALDELLKSGKGKLGRDNHE
ncbi:MAG: CDC48 family AAA ATPase [Pirellula sp.]|jgi:transitional endoplasmic reticulum ATPase